LAAIRRRAEGHGQSSHRAILDTMKEHLKWEVLGYPDKVLETVAEDGSYHFYGLGGYMQLPDSRPSAASTSRWSTTARTCCNSTSSTWPSPTGDRGPRRLAPSVRAGGPARDAAGRLRRRRPGRQVPRQQSPRVVLPVHPRRPAQAAQRDRVLRPGARRRAQARGRRGPLRGSDRRGLQLAQSGRWRARASASSVQRSRTTMSSRRGPGRCARWRASARQRPLATENSWPCQGQLTTYSSDSR